MQTLVRKLICTDDSDFVAHTERDMQVLMNRNSTISTAFGLTIGLKKKKNESDVYSDNWCAIQGTFYVNGTILGIVGTFVYLGSTLSWGGSLDVEIHTGIQKASVAFGNFGAAAIVRQGWHFSNQPDSLSNVSSNYPAKMA